LTVGPKIIDQTVRQHMKSALSNIRSGKFARGFIREMTTNRRRYLQLLREAEEHPIEKTGLRLRQMMVWKRKQKTASLPAARGTQHRS
jgi:ketol-acid reductoisomerase